jgi:hypothetical protein
MGSQNLSTDPHLATHIRYLPRPGRLSTLISMGQWHASNCCCSLKLLDAAVYGTERSGPRRCAAAVILLWVSKVNDMIAGSSSFVPVLCSGSRVKDRFTRV